MNASDLDAACAGLLCVGFDGTTPTAEVLDLVRRGVYGVILFARNVESAEQVAELSATLKRAAGRPLLVTIDQEGGRVARLRARQGFTELPPMRALGDAGDERTAFEVGALLGRELRAVGIDQDYAPVVDVDTNPANPVIGDRSLSRDPETVGRLGAALARGIQSSGVAACAKHFPGHGDTSQDSHVSLPRLPHPLGRLEAVELLPFRALSAAGVASVMTAHVVFEALDPGVPATMSRAALTGLLRGELGFTGVVVSDDLEMKAITTHFGAERAAVAGLQAGVDLFLVCHAAPVQRRVIQALADAVASGQVPEEAVRSARRRVDALLARFGRGPEDRVAELGSDAHRALAEGIAAATPAGADPTARA